MANKAANSNISLYTVIYKLFGRIYKSCCGFVLTWIGGNKQNSKIFQNLSPQCMTTETRDQLS